MKIYTGAEAETMMRKLEWAEAVPGYYDYTETIGNRQGNMSVVIRQSDKQCLFFWSKRHYGSIVLDGTLAEFKTLTAIKMGDIKEMIECAMDM